MRPILIALLIFFSAVIALADVQPIDVLRDGVQESLQVLKQPKSLGLRHRADQQQQLIKLMHRLFDFHEFSRRVLAHHWRAFSPEQRSAFVQVFSDFLGRYYVGRILDNYKDERLVYLGQTMETPKRALVNVAVIWRERQIPVDLRMVKRKGLWKVYEIQVVGISAVGFYRAQFRSLLRNESPAQVIERIQQHIEKMDSR